MPRCLPSRKALETGFFPFRLARSHSSPPGRPLDSGRVRSLTLAGVLAAVLAGLVLAGCGGSSSDTKANETYADGVCTAVASWEQSIKDIATDFSGGISKASLQKKLDQAQTATNTLVSDIKAVPPPDTDEGKAAKQQLDQLTGDVKTTVNTGKNSLAQLQDNASARHHHRGGGRARTSGAEPRERGDVCHRHPEGRRRLARRCLQEHRLLQEPESDLASTSGRRRARVASRSSRR